MAKKKKEKVPVSTGEKILQIINLVAIVAVLGILTYRAYSYKAYFDGLLDAQAPAESTLASALKEKAEGNLSVFKDENDDYYYIDDPDNNYVIYSGKLFRVIRILKSDIVKMVAEDTVGISALNRSESFDQSALSRWLNADSENPVSTGIFENSLRDAHAFLTGSTFCIDRIDDASHIACTVNSPEVDVTMLTLEDYLSTGGAKGFLNNGQEYWLASNTNDYQYWYVNSQGDLSISDYDTQLIGIRPVVFVNFNALVASGAGTRKDPFVLKGDIVSPAKASELSGGKYVSYSDKLWRVIRVDENGAAELILQDYVRNSDGQEVSVSYGTASSYSSSSGAGEYLNSTFLQTLDRYEEFLEVHKWYYGGIKQADGFDYKGNFDYSTDCYVGIPNSATMYNGGFNGIFLSSYDAHNTDTIYVFDENGNLYADFAWKTYKLRPTVALKDEISITGGNGTADNPYTLDIAAASGSGEVSQ